MHALALPRVGTTGLPAAAARAATRCPTIPALFPPSNDSAGTGPTASTARWWTRRCRRGRASSCSGSSPWPSGWRSTATTSPTSATWTRTPTRAGCSGPSRKKKIRNPKRRPTVLPSDFGFSSFGFRRGLLQRRHLHRSDPLPAQHFRGAPPGHQPGRELRAAHGRVGPERCPGGAEAQAGAQTVLEGAQGRCCVSGEGATCLPPSLPACQLPPPRGRLGRRRNHLDPQGLASGESGSLPTCHGVSGEGCLLGLAARLSAWGSFCRLRDGSNADDTRGGSRCNERRS